MKTKISISSLSGRFGALILAVGLSVSSLTAQEYTNSFLLPTTFTDGVYLTLSDTETRNSGNGGLSATSAPAANVHVSAASQSSLANRILEIDARDNHTQFLQPSRYSLVDPGRAGIIQYNIDLTPYDSYLLANGLSASSIEIRLRYSTNNTYARDVYLSYSDPTNGVNLSSITTTGESHLEISQANYTNLFGVGNAGTLGNIAGNSLLVLALDDTATTTSTISYDVAALYNAGIKEFNLILAFNASSGSDRGRNLRVLDDSGVYLTVIPEPSAAALLTGIGALVLVGGHRFVRK